MDERDAQANKWVSWLPHRNIDDTIEWLKEIKWKQDSTPQNDYIRGFVLRETGELFGSGGLIWEEDYGLFQVGYNIKESHWNKGYTTEAMKAIFEFAAMNLGIKRLAGGHAKENLASKAVLEKLGFVYDRDDITPHIDGIRNFDSREYYLDLEVDGMNDLINLSKWKIEDAPELAVALNNKKILDNLRDGLPFPYTDKDAEEFISTMLAADKNTTYAFAITYDDKTIGSIGVFRKDNVHCLTGELGYYIAEPYWGKGITTEAIRQICDNIFENTDIIRVFATPYANNTASCRVLEKAGFQFEGTLRQNAIKNGQILDMKLYAKLKRG